MRHPQNYTHNKIMETLSLFPNITSAEVMDLLPELPKSSVYTFLSKGAAKGMLVEGPKKYPPTGEGYKQRTYAVNPNYTPKQRHIQTPVKPTEAGFNARIEELHAKLAELESWKADAIARFPDLAVPPLVLTARKLAADEVRAGGDSALANQIMAGQKDGTMLVRVTLKALESLNVG